MTLSKSITTQKTYANKAARVILPIAILAFNLMPLYGQDSTNVSVTGVNQIASTARKVTGEVTGSSVQSARTGRDFHIVISKLPESKPVQLELGFVELEHDAASIRTFNLTVNEKPALSDFDIVREAGGPFKSIVKKFSITPTAGTLDFHFTSITGEAAISFIRVTGQGVNKLIAPPTTISPTSPASDETLIPPDQQGSFDVESATIHLDDTVQSWSSGVPIGGIGTGKFEILPNGQFANFTINNSWDLPVLRPPGTFLAIAAKATSSGGSGRLLQVNPTDSSGKAQYPDVPLVSEVDYKGQFPFAEWNFKDEKIPLKFTVSAWSPLVPNNLAESSLPAGLVNVTVENPMKYPISTAVALSWEDLNGRGGSLLPGDQHGFTGRTTHQDAATSSITGIQISSDYNLQNREATFTGNYFIGTPIEGAVITRKLSWNPRGGSISWWKQFSSKLRLDKIPNTPDSVTSDPKSGPTASTLCVSFNLAPKEVRRIPFIVSWYLPQITTMDAANATPTIEQPDYATHYPSAISIASYLAKQRVSMRKASDEWFDLVTRSTIPAWLKAHALNSQFPVKSNSILLKNQRFAMLESLSDMKGMMGSIDLRMQSGDFLRSLFPDLEKSELNLYARAQESTGHIPRYVGNIHGAIADFDTNLLGSDWIDPTSCWLLQVAACYRETGDQPFLDAIKPAITKARDYVRDNITKDSPTLSKNVYTVSHPGSDSAIVSKINALAGLRAAQYLLGETDEDIDKLLSEHIADFDLAQTTSTFAAALSGQRALQQAGLAPLFSADAIATFIKKTHEQNFSTKPVPTMDSTIAGFSDDTYSYPTILQSTLGALAISAGLPELGLEPYVRMFQVAYAAQKNPWKQALRYSVPTGARSQVRSHRSAMGAWSIFRALSGVIHDVPNQKLYLNPHSIANSSGEMEIPVFTPAFWGWLKYHAADSTGTLTILKVNPDFTSSSITSIASGISPDGSDINPVTFDTPFTLEVDATIELVGWPNKSGGTVNPQMPILTQADDSTTSASTSPTNEASTETEQGTLSPETSATETSRDLEQGQEMPPTPEKDDPTIPE